MTSCHAYWSPLLPQKTPLPCTHGIGVISKAIGKVLKHRSRLVSPGERVDLQPREVARRASSAKQDLKTEVPQLPAHTVAVVGTDGSGKTRLVAELLRLKASWAALTCRVACPFPPVLFMFVYIGVNFPISVNTVDLSFRTNDSEDLLSVVELLFAWI